MAQQETLATNDATDAATQDIENQAPATKTYTQDEVNDMMARMRGSLEKKLLKPYADLGDPEELRSLRSEAEQRAQEQQIKRGEFEKTLQDLAAKKDSEIHKRDAKIREYQINMPLLSAAAQYRAVNAEQVKALLASNVKLNDDGEVEVVDSKGSVRYTDAGELFQVQDLVKEFLDTNPHFVAAAPTTTNTKSNVDNRVNSVDVSTLNLKNPEHRRLYAEMQKK